MSAITNILLYDGQTTPVQQTFAPLSHSKDEYIWRQTGVSSVLASALVSLIFLKVKGNASLEKVRVKTIIPALETATGNNADGYTAAPRLAYTLASIQDFILPMRATTAQKKDIVAFSRNAIANVQITDALYDGVRPY